MSFIIIYITHKDEESAKSISEKLVLEKLVACANLFPIKSDYWWNGTVENDEEWVSIVKTIPENWEAVNKRVIQLHPYEVPCVMKIEVEANEKYEDWIYGSVVLA